MFVDRQAVTPRQLVGHGIIRRLAMTTVEKTATKERLVLNATKNDLAVDKRKKVIEILHQQLVDLINLQMQCKQAHWNVKGPHFIGLHELFDTVAEEIEKL